MDEQTDAAILASWARNAQPWTAAVRAGDIASRVLATDAAIVEAVRAHAPRTGVDLGCGEGWLVRALPEVAMVGVDAIPDLVARAHEAGGGEFRVLTYEQIANGQLALSVDIAICNFSLIGNEAVEGLFRAAPTYLRPNGTMLVQTVHPFMACGDAPYVDGWRSGSWAGFGGDFVDAPPWYFRTVAGWVALFARHGLRLLELREPLHPHTGRPASLILAGQLLA